jgi:GNAT superfamily N-acetyltransferase
VEPVLRPARPEDKAAVAAFTQGTFAWGDYVAGRFDDWLAAPDSLTVVAEVESQTVGLARGALLSPAEAWAQGLRVHPDHRRHGLGAALMRHLAAWAASSGARVIRLSAERENQPALRLFAGLGYRIVGHWLGAERTVGTNAPGASPGSNGGKRVPAPQRLTPAPAAEADAAMLAWAGGPLEQAAHGLFVARPWTWRRLTLADLEAAARRRALWQAPAGWAVAEQTEDALHVSWLCTHAEEARPMLRALADLAAGTAAERLEIEVPDVDWLRAALDLAGWRIFPVEVCARAL